MLDGRKVDNVYIFLTVDGYQLGRWVTNFEWLSFINNGYFVRFRLIDHNFGKIGLDGTGMSEIYRFITQDLLPMGRSEAITMKFKIGWDSENRDEYYTRERTAILTKCDCPNLGATKGVIDIEGIDPASWYLNIGTTSGKAYVGPIGGDDGVISQCIKEHVGHHINKSKIKVSKTNDNKKGIWYPMRTEPKTFINTLLEWSCSLNSSQTPWVVHSQDDYITVKDLNSTKPPKDRDGNSFINREVIISNKGPATHELTPKGMKILNNINLSILQSNLYTAGISTVTGKYVDKNNNKKFTRTYDDNTPKKFNAKIDNIRGFSKPGSSQSIGEASKLIDSATFIKAVPEHNNGDVAIKYWEYFDGRSIDYFTKMLYTTMRIQVNITGDKNFDDVNIIGPGTVKLCMASADSNKYNFIEGEWMIYGWYHHGTSTDWTTTLYLSRLDYNAKAINPRG